MSDYTHYNDVNDWLSVGTDLDLAGHVTGRSCFDVAVELLGHNVTHVLDLRIEAVYEDREVWTTAGLRGRNYTNVPVVDERGYTPPDKWFDDVETAVRAFWTESAHGDRLYSHCFMGSNRGPSAAMLALLTVDPQMHPFDAFLRIRAARPVAGVRYAEMVGIRHMVNQETFSAKAIGEFRAMLDSYWTPDLRREHGAGIDHYLSLATGVDTLAV